MIRSVVIGSGAVTPRTVVPNASLEERVETTSEWIIQRTGIEQRYIAEEDETTASLGEAAARAAMDDAGVSVDDIDLIILATSTPIFVFQPSTVMITTGACSIQIINFPGPLTWKSSPAGISVKQTMTIVPIT